MRRQAEPSAGGVKNSQVGTAKMQAKARTASGAERAALWEKAVVIWPPFADYQRKAVDREIPVVVLDPVA